jgi:hypothetical protein
MATSGDLGGSEKCGTEAAAACANAEEEVEGAAARSSFSLDSAAAGEARRGREVEAAGELWRHYGERVRGVGAEVNPSPARARVSQRRASTSRALEKRRKLAFLGSQAAASFLAPASRARARAKDTNTGACSPRAQD